MYKITLLCLLATVLFSCKNEHEPPLDKSKTVVTVDYTTDITPDSIVITDHDFKQWHSFKNGEIIRATFSKNVPYIYIVAFYINGKHYTKDLWLNNGNPHVKLSLINKEVITDTIYNAPVYYEFADFFKQLDDFDKSKDSIARDKFMLSKIDKHFNDCFSNIVSANYMIYHQNNNKKLSLLYDKIKGQDSSIKNGYMSDYATLQK